MADIDPKIDRPDRCPGVTYTDMLAVDTRPAPDYLVMESTQELGDEPLDPARYTSAVWKTLEDE